MLKCRLIHVSELPGNTSAPRQLILGAERFVYFSTLTSMAGQCPAKVSLLLNNNSTRFIYLLQQQSCKSTEKNHILVYTGSKLRNKVEGRELAEAEETTNKAYHGRVKGNAAILWR